MPDLIGETIGEYQIIERIGRGGMADVYRAYQPSLNRDVAVKILPAYYAEQDDTFLPRFKIEAQSIAKLRHQNILMVMNYGEHKNTPYIVMEYVSAGTLKDRIRIGMTLSEILEIIRQIGSALDYAHEQGVIHRDVKPSNILMPKPDWALLTDFGLARMVGGSNLTQSGMTVGTPSYMSPEQGSGKKVDNRSDLYSLGVMLYEMTVGELPYQAETPMAVVVKHIVEPLPMPRTRNPLVPEDLQKVILKAIAKDPDDRFQTAAEMVKALETTVKNFEERYGEGAVLEDGAETLMFDDMEAAVQPEHIPPVRMASNTLKTAQKKEPFNWKLAAMIGGAALIVGLIVGGVLMGGFTILSQLNQPSPTLVVTPNQENIPSTQAPQVQQPDGPLEPRTTPLPTKSPPTQAAPAVGYLQGPSGQILFEDDFSDPESGWDQYDFPNGSAAYVDGTYTFMIDDSNYLWWATSGRAFLGTVVDVDAELISGTVDNAFGVVCGFQETGVFYTAVISSNGYYDFYRVTEDSIISLLEEGVMEISDAIHLGEQTNHLRVLCTKEKMTLTVNDQFVDEITGLNILPGDIGFWAETFDGEGAEIRFDNLVVTAP